MAQDRELELAVLVQQRKKALLALLTPAEQRTTRRVGSTAPDTFEEKAQQLVERGDARAAFVREALTAYQEAVNGLWMLAIQNALPEKIAAGWKRKHRGYEWLSSEDVQAEVIFQLRAYISRYTGENSASLYTFCMQGVHERLIEWAAQQGPVQLPEKVARAAGPDFYREQMPDPEDERTAYDPWDLVNAYLDGEISEDDL